MRLLIVGALEGQLTEATKLAMDGGARVAHAPSVEIALATLRAGRGADLLLVDVLVDIPGFYLTRPKQALDLIEKVSSSNLYVQYDIYHMQIMEGDLARTIEANLARIAHVQLADNPGRFEPGTGEINYRYLFGFLDQIGYDGWIGCEYKPRAGTTEGLGWRADHGVL